MFLEKTILKEKQFLTVAVEMQNDKTRKILEWLSINDFG